MAVLLFLKPTNRLRANKRTEKNRQKPKRIDAIMRQKQGKALEKSPRATRRTVLPNRIYASIPANDIRFAELRAFFMQQLMATPITRNSPVPRIAGEWMLAGYLLMNGKLGNVGEILQGFGTTNQNGLSEAQQEVGDMVSAFSFD